MPDAVPEAPCRMLVGLGNPGREYVGTRHNVGFEVLDRIAGILGVRFERLGRGSGLPGKVKALAALCSAEWLGRGGRLHGGGEKPFLLVKPKTYMNLSGSVVAALARQHELPPESIFVIFDDLNLPLGRMRIRPGGGPGGHNGMKSLLACLGSEGFPRLRLGIGAVDLPPHVMADPDFVLDRFLDDERKVIEPVLDVAVQASLRWLFGEPVPELMSEFNGFRAGESAED